MPPPMVIPPRSVGAPEIGVFGIGVAVTTTVLGVGVMKTVLSVGVGVPVITIGQVQEDSDIQSGFRQRLKFVQTNPPSQSLFRSQDASHRAGEVGVGVSVGVTVGVTVGVSVGVSVGVWV